MSLARRVTVEDLRTFHRHCNHCLGQVVLTFHELGKPPRQQLCALALQEFARATAGRVETVGERGDAYWVSGRTPEEWQFTEMFFIELLEWAWRRDFHTDAMAWAARQHTSAAEVLKDFYAEQNPELLRIASIDCLTGKAVQA